MNNTKMKTLLPIKQTDGQWLYRTQVLDEEVSDASDEVGEEVSDHAKQPTLPSSTSLVHVYASEKSKLVQVKRKVALLCSSFIGDPENNMRSLKELILMLKNLTTKMVVTEKKLLALSLMKVFADVLPTYKIRTNQEVDKKVKLKKQTKVLMNYEQSLLRYYKKYIDSLQVMTNDMKGKAKRKNGAFTGSNKRACIKVGIIATQCLCKLLVSRYYFNYYKSIISIIVPLACSKNSEVSELCCAGLENLYKSDKLGESSLEAVRQTVKIVKERKFCVPPRLLKTFLYLRLQEVKTDNKSRKEDMKKIRKQMRMMSRKEKKYQKKMQELEKQLRETEAEESKETKSKLQTETLKKVFWIYFHVLKDDAKVSLITPVLEGLSKFAHLINLEFFDDLSSVLNSLMDKEHLTDMDKLHCMQTVFIILSGKAESLNVDPQRLYSHLYNLLMNLNNNTDIEHFHVLVKCFYLMLIKRKKNITSNRLLAFVKRLSTVSLQMPLHFTLSALCLMKILMLNTKDSDILLDTENSVGTGMFQPDLEDPEYCNPRSTCLWELHLLLSHYCSSVSTYGNHIINSCPIQGKFRLPETLIKLQPDEALDSYNEVASGKTIAFVDHKRPAKRLCVRNSSDYVTTLIPEENIYWQHVANVKFQDAFY